MVIDSWNHRRRIVKEKSRATCDFSFFFFFFDFLVTVGGFGERNFCKSSRRRQTDR